MAFTGYTKKIIPQLFVENQTMTDYNPSKSIRSITRNMVVSEFIRQVVYEDIQHFSYKMKND